jgi:DNA-binding ferritin-like protein
MVHAEEIRAETVEPANVQLADCIDLRTQTKQTYWNAKGLNFIALHKHNYRKQ